MQPPNDEHQVCANCGTRPAIKSYSRAALTEELCDTCFDRWSAQDALEDKLLHLIALGRDRKYDEALACLDEILESNRDRDHDGWLARSIANHRVLILLDAGRHAQAEQACEAWAELGFSDVSERWMHALGTAHAMEALGRDREGVAALEDALGHQDPRYLPSAPGLLAELARLSDKLGQPVDPRWRHLAEAVADEYGVEMPARESFGQALLALAELTRGARPKRQREWEAEHGADADE